MHGFSRLSQGLRLSSLSREDVQPPPRRPPASSTRPPARAVQEGDHTRDPQPLLVSYGPSSCFMDTLFARLSEGLKTAYRKPLQTPPSPWTRTPPWGCRLSRTARPPQMPNGSLTCCLLHTRNSGITRTPPATPPDTNTRPAPTSGPQEATAVLRGGGLHPAGRGQCSKNGTPRAGLTTGDAHVPRLKSDSPLLRSQTPNSF